MRTAVLAGLALALVQLPTGAHANEMRRHNPYGNVASGPEGVGCYWYRQQQYCSRYCYWEVNGRRYCRERAREAYPQAPFLVSPDYPSGPMKLGVGK